MSPENANEHNPLDASPLADAIDDDGGGRPSVSDGQIDIPDELPILGIDNFVLFPFMIAPMLVGEGHAKQLVDEALNRDRLLGVFLKKDSGKGDAFDNLYEVGTLAIILKMLRMPDGSMRLLLHGTDRIHIEKPEDEEPYPRAAVERLEDTNADSWPVQAMVRSVQSLIGKIVKLGHLPEDLGASVNEISDPGKLADLAISHLSVKTEERQEILELVDVEDRLEKVLEILGRETQVLELGSEIQSKVMTQVDKRQREYMLREQLKTIREELGETEEASAEVEELRETIRKARLPKYAQETADRELKRLEAIHPSSPEYSVTRNYLDWLADMPWQKTTRDSVDIKKAQTILDEDHYDLTEVKERILEYLAVIKLKKKLHGSILCFVGPPGVGKTSLGRSIARALGRKFARISLGGMRDEAEIRGHRRTYIGAMPGRLVKTIRDAKSKNPLIMLDEIDKLGQDFRGDPASALLEVLDPEQNSTFTDNYLDMPFDLSNVLFITTANTLDPIPSPLRDRMEILKLSGYTVREKTEIAKRYLVPRAHENTGVSEKLVEFSEEGLRTIVEHYTREAGVRNLEREIQNVCRKVARRVAEGDKSAIKVDGKVVRDMLGPRRVYSEVARRMGQPGVAIGLAWTPTGGEILFVEATAVPGNGQLLLTGQLGDVMKESAMAAVNFLHSHGRELRIDEAAFSKQNFHVHVPAGATPKDGPSAGITLASALCSLLMHEPIKDRLAMTGEITLKGNVLPVGGVKEKVLAAHRAGIKEIILPARSEETLTKDIPDEVREDLKFHFVEHIAQVFRIAFPNQSERMQFGPGREQQQRDRAPEQPRQPEREPRQPEREARQPEREARQPEREDRHPEKEDRRPPREEQRERRDDRRNDRRGESSRRGSVTITKSQGHQVSHAEPSGTVLKIEPDKNKDGDGDSRRSRSRQSSRPQQNEERYPERTETEEAVEEIAPDETAETAQESAAPAEEKRMEEKRPSRRSRSRRSSSRSRRAQDETREEDKKEEKPEESAPEEKAEEKPDAEEAEKKEEKKPSRRSRSRRSSSRSRRAQDETREEDKKEEKPEESAPEEKAEEKTDADEAEKKEEKKPSRRSRSRRSSSRSRDKQDEKKEPEKKEEKTEEKAAEQPEESAEKEETEAPAKKKTTRSRSRRSTSRKTTSKATEEKPDAEPDKAEEKAEEAPAKKRTSGRKTTRRRRTTKTESKDDEE